MKTKSKLINIETIRPHGTSMQSHQCFLAKFTFDTDGREDTVVLPYASVQQLIEEGLEAWTNKVNSGGQGTTKAP